MSCNSCPANTGNFIDSAFALRSVIPSLCSSQTIVTAPESASALSNSNTVPVSTQCGNGVPNGCNGACESIPIVLPTTRQYRLCCDGETGVCALYPQECRNSFWPDFAHPRWLSCNTLYCTNVTVG